MTILNLMLGKGRGGLEQAGVDYAESLAHAGIATLTITHPDAWVNPALEKLPHLTLRHVASWDPFAILRLRKLAHETNATAVICHGNRALRMALTALKGRVPVIAVAHNYSIARFVHADRVFCITHDLIEEMVHRDYPRNQMFHMPNMVRIPTIEPRAPFREPPVIATMGRFVKKKAFDVFIDAVRELKQRGLAFHAILGGDGEDRPLLEARAKGLEDVLTFSGWVQDKAQFFHNADVFVLPSHHEPFGIVLIEAMAYRVPVITTDSEGPCEIVHPGKDALLTRRGDAQEMADAMESLITSEAGAKSLADAAFDLVSSTYSIDAMAERLKVALKGLS
jgi:glycosyltransferase involved in cell wall biosynthesis